MKEKTTKILTGVGLILIAIIISISIFYPFKEYSYIIKNEYYNNWGRRILFPDGTPSGYYYTIFLYKDGEQINTYSRDTITVSDSIKCIRLKGVKDLVNKLNNNDLPKCK